MTPRERVIAETERGMVSAMFADALAAAKGRKG